MFLKILLVLCIALEFVFVPLFLYYQWPGKCVKSLTYKMISSSLFLFAALAVIQISGNYTPYAKLILWGLVFGWLGDLFLHLLTDKIWVFGIGLFAFLGGHIFYIVAFQKAIRVTYPAASSVAWYEILVVALILAAVVLYATKKKINLKNPMVIPVAMYAITISTMFLKALRYTIGELAYGTNDHMVLLFLTVALGAVLFVLSDGTLGMLLFGGQKTNKPLKIFNIATYYAAQVLLALSIFLVRTPILYGR